MLPGPQVQALMGQGLGSGRPDGGRESGFRLIGAQLSKPDQDVNFTQGTPSATTVAHQPGLSGRWGTEGAAQPS